MTKIFRPDEPGQPLLMPASLRDWLPEDHLVHAVSDAVDRFEDGHAVNVDCTDYH